MPPATSTDAAARFLPLSPQVFQMLLSLVDGPRHGYAIITDIRERTDGEIRLTASTLYDALSRLVDQRLIEELDAPPNPEDHDSRRRYYRLSALGSDTARLEARRLERVIEMARSKRLLHAGPRAPRTRRS
jgi:DNA-binding PadR family transcriptional regulator